MNFEWLTPRQLMALKRAMVAYLLRLRREDDEAHLAGSTMSLDDTETERVLTEMLHTYWPNWQ